MQTLSRRTPQWLLWARRLHALKVELGGSCACRTTVHPHETAQTIEAVERYYGLELPPSYREFLLRYDGWRDVYRGASLLSCAQLLDPSWLYLAESAIRRGRTPVPGFAADDWRREELVPIGLDPAAELVFVFDPTSARPDGEMDAVAWMGDIGIRMSTFSEFLELLCEMTESGGSIVQEQQEMGNAA